jgi:hypothetical protein
MLFASVSGREIHRKDVSDLANNLETDSQCALNDLTSSELELGSTCFAANMKNGKPCRRTVAARSP